MPMQLLSDYPLDHLNTFGIKASAREFAEINNDEELKDLLTMQHLGSRQLLLLGGGSNILFTGNFGGTVIRINTRGMERIREDEDQLVLKVAAGEDWDSLVAHCVEQGWGGLENLSGIPGQVGSSPIQNIGAYGSELKDIFHSLDGIFLCTGETFHYDAEQCQFGYRDSIFKRALKGRAVITHVSFILSRNPRINPVYQALKQKLAHIPVEDLTLQDIRKTVLEIRASKLPDPKIIGNAGSFFKNPVVKPAQMEALKERFPEIVYFEVPVTGNIAGFGATARSAGFKLAAGWLIEQCGWKGYREGDAGVHKDQALVLVNHGNATGMQIMELAGKVQRSVLEKFGVLLEKEVNVV